MTSILLRSALIITSIILILATLTMLVRGQLGYAAVLGVLTSYAVSETRTIFGSRF